MFKSALLVSSIVFLTLCACGPMGAPDGGSGGGDVSTGGGSTSGGGNVSTGGGTASGGGNVSTGGGTPSGGGNVSTGGGSSGGGTASGGGNVSDGGYALGSVAAKGNCRRGQTALQNAHCETVTVSGCSGVVDIDVDLVIAEPADAGVIGTIIFGSGSGGGSLYEGVGATSVTAMENLRNAGYRIIERAWAGPPQTGQWFEGTAGPAASNCRYSTLATWLRARYASGAFCATGNSGGSMEIGMSLSRWGRGAIFDAVLMTSGPAARFDESCGSASTWLTKCATVTSPYTWQCNGQSPQCTLDPGIQSLIDSAYSNQMFCRNPATHLTQLESDSALSVTAGGVKDFPNTTVAFLYGAMDCDNGVAPAGLAYASQVTTRGQAASIQVLQNVGHSMAAFDGGAYNIEQRLKAICHQ